MREIISELFDRIGLGEITGDVLPVSGGLMHKMYKVKTAKGTYAVKCLNPEIMKRPGVFENYAEAEMLECILEDNNIPVVSAIDFSDKKMLEEGGRYFYIFNWQEGHTTDFDNISKEQCLIAGEILGRIHSIDSQVFENEAPELSNIDFKKYLKLAEEKSGHVFPALNENIELLEYAQDRLNNARKKLPPLKVISDDDMDPKNIIWDKEKAYVIDLECLGYSNPVSSCIELSLQWAGIVTGNFKRENLEAFINGYLSKYDNGFRAYDELLGLCFSWVEWLEYNLRRALGMEGSSDEEIILGEKESLNTIERIKYLKSVETDICKVFKEI